MSKQIAELTRSQCEAILNDDWVIADDCDGMVNCEEIKSMARMAIKFINLNDKCCKISDISYVNGLKRGFSLGQTNNQDDFHNEVERYRKGIRDEIKNTSGVNNE